MMKLRHLMVPCVLAAAVCLGQWGGDPSLTQEDHQLMLKKLGIEQLRPGPSGNPGAPNAANSDESKASPYDSLPDPLVFEDGSPVKTAAQWRERRAEIMEHFDREIYGRVPDRMPAVRWEVVKTVEFEFEGRPVMTQTLAGHVDASNDSGISVDIQLTLVTPCHPDKPVPVILEFGWGGGQPGHLAGWQSEALRRGWACAVIVPGSIQADHGAGLRSGIIGLMNEGRPRELDDWGALRAWAWGASRAIDYFEEHPAVDATRVAIEGLSRYGKAAIVAQAYDERIAVGLIGSSGAGGAALLRRVFGEQVENLASSGEYHWFAPNFIKYAGPLTPNDLPVDAHELIALCAPRPIFISVGSPNVEGQWIDGRGMFIAGVHAGPVYELLGKTGLGTTEYPEEKEALVDGDIAFRMHEGGHTVGPNWTAFMNWAEPYLNTSNGDGHE